jgi:predicted DCC family thiol-disulfide oxidoreductase YuxK
MKALVLYDGSCGLCNRFVRFVVRRDPQGVHHFAALDSSTGRKLLQHHQVPAGVDSTVLVDESGLHIESTAALRILRRMRWPWPLLGLFLWVPRSWRDHVYRMIARRRRRWFGATGFGATGACTVLDPVLRDPALRTRFLDD